MDEIRPYLFIVCGIISLIYVFKLKDSGDIKSCIVTGIVCLALGYFTWPESEEEESEYYPTMQSYYQPSFGSYRKYKCKVGGCLCTDYKPKSTFNSDCKNCGHAKEDHPANWR